MKHIFAVLVLMWCCSFNFLQAQSPAPTLDSTAVKELKVIEDTLSLFAYAILNAKEADQRFLAVRAFIPMLTKALKIAHSFDYSFERLHNISIQYPQDSTFRIFSWQLYVDSSDYRYYGAIQMNTPTLKLIPLADRSFQVEKNADSLLLSNDNWYGAVYYNIRDFDTPEGKKYLLFGYDNYQNFERFEEQGDRNREFAFSHNDYEHLSKRKIIDVLSFDKGKVLFGAPVFVHMDGNNKTSVVKNRVVLEFSADAVVSCNYDEFEQMIIFDHLMPMSEVIPGEKPVYMPDGTYEGYRLNNGQWVHLQNVFNTTVNEAPREQPVLDQRTKDLFGKSPKQ
ncbi:MAG: hypothetical protein HC912_06405 [Saprospiraceae bacterium]|nr:hypothetical protein [Saprospiraceae bacterium]